ncbi:PEP-CTERM sorting domain-containing protein [Nitrosospira sp. NpAV]|uniref:PEP-CTERM sorting domain-containing protein n=1 Tax=Nitrosospira sp. NpAV TaxID=58133 RepID=UPI000698E995|nr:PEP-CTERM sorting domain-containing protein [Nitrosospira sp. NpAV]
MNTSKILLQSAALLIVVFSGSVHAIPILQVYAAGATDEGTYSVQYNHGSMSRPEADSVLFPVHPSAWNENTGGNSLLGEFSGLKLLYSLYSAFAAPLLSSPAAGFTIFDLPLGEITANDEGIGSSEDENTIIGFLATLGLDAADWGKTERSPEAPGQQAPSDQAPNNTVTPRRARTECSQRHYGQPQKSGLREDDLCFGGGGPSGAGSRGGRGLLTARSGDAGGGSGGGAPGSNGSGSNGPGSNGPGGNGPGSNGPGGGTGPGGGGPGDVDPPTTIPGGPGDVDPPTTIPGEVGTIPEPATLVLLGLGFASMYIVRGRKTASASRNQPYRN